MDGQVIPNGWSTAARAEMSETTLHPETMRRRGNKNNLIEIVIKQVDAHCKHGRHSATAMSEIVQAVRRYQKEAVR